MDRRASLKNLFLGSVAGGLALHGCKPGTESEAETLKTAVNERYFGRTPEEKERIAKLRAETFFTPHEMETISVLSERILPPTEAHGGPLEAEVPAFIEFMAKDIPEMQGILRGGLMWLDHQSNAQYQKVFAAATEEQQKAIMDTIAWYDPEVPLSEQPLGIQFFSLMRNLTVCGYYTSEVGIAELGYKGNQPNLWDGVPQHVLDKHGLAYEEEWLAKCIDHDTRGVIAEWDEEGNLLT